MKTEDLSQVKYIGASRLKLLNDMGITTVAQLYQTPTDKLAQIPTIGRYYAKLIKAAVIEYSGEKAGQDVPDPVSDKEKKLETIKNNLTEQIKVLKNHLKRTNEELTPPEKKKNLKLVNNLKKKSETLMNRLDGLDQIQGDLSKKISKKITTKVEILNAKLQHMRGKIKKKKFQKLSDGIQSFSKMLKKIAHRK